MKYLSEILKIIENGMEGDKDKLKSYSELMIQKMREDGLNKEASLIEKRISGEYKKDLIVRPVSEDSINIYKELTKYKCTYTTDCDIGSIDTNAVVDLNTGKILNIAICDDDLTISDIYETYLTIIYKNKEYVIDLDSEETQKIPNYNSTELYKRIFHEKLYDKINNEDINKTKKRKI